MCRSIQEGGRRCAHDAGPVHPSARSSHHRTARRLSAAEARAARADARWDVAGQAAYDELAEALVAARSVPEARRTLARRVALRAYVGRVARAYRPLVAACQRAHGARVARITSVQGRADLRARIEQIERALTEAEAHVTRERLACRPRGEWLEGEIWRGLVEVTDIDPLQDDLTEEYARLGRLRARRRATSTNAQLEWEISDAEARCACWAETLRRLRADLAAAPDSAEDAQHRIERAEAAVAQTRAAFAAAMTEWMKSA